MIHANWKIVAENYVDVYHLAHLHATTLNMYAHDQARFAFEGNHYWFWEPLAKAYRDNLAQLIPFKRIKEVGDGQLGAYVPWLFPNLGLAATESSWSLFQLIPLAPDKTKVLVRTKLEPMSDWEYYRQQKKSTAAWEKVMGKGPKATPGQEDGPLDSGDFMEEDAYVCEQQQKSLKNPLFNVGATAQHQESPVVGFQKVVQAWMAAG